MDTDAELRRISDRLAVEDLLFRYSRAIDTRNFDLLDEVFTPDGVADYTSSGGIRGTLAEVKEWLGAALGVFTVVQHLITNVAVDFAGDEARSTCYMINPLGYPAEGDKTEMIFCGGLYHDQLVRTAEGWRIRERVIELLYLDGKLPGS